MKFAELVGQKTNGEVEIRVFPDSQLGGILDMFTGMKAGSLEMVYGGINTYGFIKGGEVFQITAVPFLYRDYDHMWKVLNSPVFQPHLEAAEKATGVKVIVINGDTAPRELTTRDKPVRTAADFKGLKIRIAESAMVRAAMQKLGANPQVIPFADLYMALKQGVLDAQENGVIPIKNMSFYAAGRAARVVVLRGQRALARRRLAAALPAAGQPARPHAGGRGQRGLRLGAAFLGPARFIPVRLARGRAVRRAQRRRAAHRAPLGRRLRHRTTGGIAFSSC